MSNPQISADWKQSAENLKKKLDDLNVAFSPIKKDISDTESTIIQLQNLSLTLQNNLNTLQRQNASSGEIEKVQNNLATVNTLKIGVENELNNLVSLQSQYEQRVNELNFDITNANRQAEIANQGLPNVSSATSPANPEPGNNTSIPVSEDRPFVIPVTQNDIVIPADSTGVATVIPPTAQPIEITPSTPAPISPAVAEFVNLDLDNIAVETREELFGPQQSIGIDSDDQLLEREFERRRQIEEADDIQRQKDADQYQAEFEAQQSAEYIQYQSDIALNTETGDEAIAAAEQIAQGLDGTPINPADDPYVAQFLDGKTVDIANDPFVAQGLDGIPVPGLDNARRSAPQEAAVNWKSKSDWRVRLSLAPEANYLYRATNAGILSPLKETDGVLFPYTPRISVSYSASYTPSDITHSNYKLYSYNNSNVDNFLISCDFTAQDTFEANYLLAVIHFFRSVTKMFYGQDENPRAGTPPPLCYIFGMGEFQFNAHPLVINNFGYTLPTDVDYIRTNSQQFLPGTNQEGLKSKNFGNNLSEVRLGPNIRPGAINPAPNFSTQTGENITYVPTMMSIDIQAYPIVTRNDISNKFSLRDYASGSLLQGTRRRAGGIW